MSKYFLLLDTEAIDLNKPYIYDIGYIVVDQDLQPATYGHMILSQVYDNDMLFNTAYYGNKRPIYTSRLKGRTARKTFVGHAMRTLNSLIKNYDIKRVYAYNIPFDNKAFTFTTNFFKVNNPLDQLEKVDIQAIANRKIHNTKAYKEFAKNKGYVSEKGYLQMSVEKTFEFLRGEPFQENHLGLDDCFVELDILKACNELEPQKRKFIKA